MNDIPDAFPALAAAAAYSEGDTVFTGLAHVRVKESDRVAVMAAALTKAGALVETTRDSMIVHGGRPLSGTAVESHGDHRIAMALSVAGLFARGPMEVRDAECAAVSFPGFYELMNRCGAGIELTG